MPRTEVVGDQVDKVKLNRLREAARRQCLRLSKARVADPRAVGPRGYGLYDDQEQDWFLARGEGWGCTIEEIELYLLTGKLPDDLV